MRSKRHSMQDEVAQHGNWVVLMLALDVAWISAYMGPRYQTLVRTVQGGRDMQTDMRYAVLAYGAMVLGMRELVFPAADRARAGVVWGALAYGTYNGTAGAVFKDWDPQLAVIDVLWGMFLGYVVAKAMPPRDEDN